MTQYEINVEFERNGYTLQLFGTRNYDIINRYKILKVIKLPKNIYLFLF